MLLQCFHAGRGLHMQQAGLVCDTQHIPEHTQVVTDVPRHDAAGYVLLFLLLLEAGQLPHPRSIDWVICVKV